MKELDTLIRASYPILWVESYEELRVMRIIRDVATKQKDKTVFIWTGTTGLCDLKGKSIKNNTEDPLAAIQYVGEVNTSAIVVFKDLHRYIDDILVYRMLRDLHEILKSSHKTVIILSPVVEIPVELQKVVTVVSLPLPGIEELSEVLESILQSVEASAVKEGDPDKESMVRLIYDELVQNRNNILSAGLGLTEDEFENVIAKSIVKHKEIKTKEIIAEKEQIIRKSGILEFYTSIADMNDVGGLDVLKGWVKKRKLAYSSEAKDFGLTIPKGVFLAGPPGTGKSLTAKVIAKYMGMPLLRLDISKIFGSYVGQSEQNITHALKTAEAVAPSVLWLDEIEKAMAGVQSSGSNDSGVTARVFGTFLTWLQEHTTPVFVVATSNNPESIPPEFIRSGRFDEVFMVNLPSENERCEIFNIHIEKVNRNPDDFQIGTYAEMTEGFSGAEIEGSVRDAMYESFFEGHDLDDATMYKAITGMIPLSKKRESDLIDLLKWGATNAVNASLVEDQSVIPSSRRIEME